MVCAQAIAAFSCSCTTLTSARALSKLIFSRRIWSKRVQSPGDNSASITTSTSLIFTWASFLSSPPYVISGILPTGSVASQFSCSSPSTSTSSTTVVSTTVGETMIGETTVGDVVTDDRLSSLSLIHASTILIFCCRVNPSDSTNLIKSAIKSAFTTSILFYLFTYLFLSSYPTMTPSLHI